MAFRGISVRRVFRGGWSGRVVLDGIGGGMMGWWIVAMGWGGQVRMRIRVQVGLLYMVD